MSKSIGVGLEPAMTSAVGAVTNSYRHVVNHFLTNFFRDCPERADPTYAATDVVVARAGGTIVGRRQIDCS
jgi:hypothetical protein